MVNFRKVDLAIATLSRRQLVKKRNSVVTKRIKKMQRIKMTNGLVAMISFKAAINKNKMFNNMKKLSRMRIWINDLINCEGLNELLLILF